jgi:hypothetical protein
MGLSLRESHHCALEHVEKAGDAQVIEVRRIEFGTSAALDEAVLDPERVLASC